MLGDDHADEREAERKKFMKSVKPVKTPIWRKLLKLVMYFVPPNNKKRK